MVEGYGAGSTCDRIQVRIQKRNTVVKDGMNATAMATDAVVTLLLVMVMSLVAEVMSPMAVVTVVRGMCT
jgi:hypothetical protein